MKYIDKLNDKFLNFILPIFSFIGFLMMIALPIEIIIGCTNHVMVTCRNKEDIMPCVNDKLYKYNQKITRIDTINKDLGLYEVYYR